MYNDKGFIFSKNSNKVIIIDEKTNKIYHLERSSGEEEYLILEEGVKDAE